MRSLALILLVIASGCSYKPEDAGLCKLVCSNAIIGGNNLENEMRLKTATVNTECAASAAGSTVGPYLGHWVAGEKILDDQGEESAFLPIPNLSVEPILIGARPGAGNDNDADQRYIGLLTAKDNWCSDSCGVIILNTLAQCPGIGGVNDVTLQVHSGAFYSEKATFGIKTKEPTN